MKTNIIDISLKIMILAAIPLMGISQNPDIKRTYHWYFGNKAGLDFSSGAPIAVTDGQMEAIEGCAAISDTCGSLLFYTDGDTVWNRDHQVMQNGTGLMGCESSTQSSLIVPQPGNDSLYFIFTTDCDENASANGMRYSMVNLNLNGGLGSVVQKNSLLFSPAFEKISATYHSNGSDIWIGGIKGYPVGPPPDSVYKYYTYLVTGSGVNNLPVISNSKIKPHKPYSGELKFSLDGKKIVSTWNFNNWDNRTELSDFNNSTGEIFNPLLIESDSGFALYGAAFSPNNTKLFLSLYSYQNNYPDWYSKIYQYDISSGDSTTISSSKALLVTADSTTENIPFFLGMQNSPNGSVLVAIENNVPPYYPDTVGIIINPNDLAPLCVFQKNAVSVGGGSRTAFPNFISNYLDGEWVPGCINSWEKPIDEIEIRIFPNPFTEHIWIDFNGQKLGPGVEKQVTVVNTFGQRIQSYSTKENTIEFDGTALSNGLYLLEVQTKTGLKTSILITKH